MFCNTIGALLTNHVVQLSSPQSPLSVHATAQMLLRVVKLPVGSLLASLSMGYSFVGEHVERIFLVGCFLISLPS